MEGLMGLRAHDEYDESKSEDWGDYVIDRRETGNFLLNTFKESDGPLSIRINASYGSGKTKFMRCLKKQAEADGFIVIYYNAWEEETSLDARSSLCLAILEKIELYSAEEKVNSKVLTLQKAILPIIAKAGISALSRFLLGDHKALIETFDAAELGNTIANALKSGLDEAQRSRQQISEIKKSLAELISSLGDKRFLILIDELDRCRPDFAIEVLETIKHFFSIKKIFSVVGVYETVLHSIIDKKYGEKIGADSYLQRHFNHTITFSKFDYEAYLISRLKNTVAFKEEWLNNDEEFDNGIICAARYASQICEIGMFNLRQVNMLVNKLDSIITTKCRANLARDQKSGTKNLFGLIIAIFCKELDTNKYEILLNSQSDNQRREALNHFAQKAKSQDFIAYLVTMISSNEAEYKSMAELILSTDFEYSQSLRPLLKKIKLANNDLIKFDSDGSGLK